MIEKTADQTARYTRWSQTHDATRRYLTKSPTPTSIAQILQSVDDGDVAAMAELTEEIEAKDPHLQGVASRRRESITALDWSIEPDDHEDVDAAQIAADYVQSELEHMDSWPTTLEHLIQAIGPGVSATELIWVEGRLVETVDVPGHRLEAGPEVGRGLSLLTEEHSTEGVPMKSPSFAVHYPNLRAGFPLRVTLTRASAYLWVIKHFVIADWTAFSEVFGMPWRVGYYEDEPNPKDKAVMEDMLKNSGPDGWGMFPASLKVELVDVAKTNQPYQAIIEWTETKQTTLWLGQTLTTEQGNVGSLALGQVHANVRASITRSDLQAERRTIRDQIIRYMVRYRWPNKGVPIPHFRRLVAESPDIELERLKLEKLRYMREAGLLVDDDIVYELLDIPKPKETKPE